MNIMNRKTFIESSIISVNNHLKKVLADDMSLIYILKSSGPKIDPCGTPVNMFLNNNNINNNNDNNNNKIYLSRVKLISRRCYFT